MDTYAARPDAIRYEEIERGGDDSVLKITVMARSRGLRYIERLRRSGAALHCTLCVHLEDEPLPRESAVLDLPVTQCDLQRHCQRVGDLLAYGPLLACAENGGWHAWRVPKPTSVFLA